MTVISVSGRLINIKGFKLDKGKLKKKPPRSVSAKIRQRKSKRSKPVRRTV